MKRVARITITYLTFIILFALQKPIFYLVTQHCSVPPIDAPWSTVWQAIRHGSSLDASMAGYLCLLPTLILIASIYIREGFARLTWNCYMGIVALLVSMTFVLNTCLYPYWRFPLDSTPLFYFFSSPADAFASTSIWISILGFVLAFLLAIGIWLTLRWKKAKKRQPLERHRWRECTCLFVILGLLFLAIRGGVTVSTMNTGQAYFSKNIYVNHVAVNPMFSLMESLTHQEDFGSHYRYMDEQEAHDIFKTLTYQGDENTYPLLNDQAQSSAQPTDIVLLIVEGLANELLPSIGSQKDVAVEIDSIAQHSILFTNFYANSFRTDRGLVAVLSGFPAQPIHSIMKYPAKSAALPSLARSLSQAKGYKSAYYYGGDVDFANQRSYLVSQGYQTIISDKDFPISDKLSKWGVPDHILANKFIEDVKQEKDKGPWLRVVQTSSSHEPFDVPYSRLKDKRLNAFAYTDSVIGSMLRQYSTLPQWKNTLVVIVADHVGAYKEQLDNYDITRYQIPLILTGGAIRQPLKINLVGSQNDIAATLLGQLGINHDDFLFSKNMMSDRSPHFAFFTVPDAFGVATKDKAVIFDNKSKSTVYKKGETSGIEKQGKAYLQTLYDVIDGLSSHQPTTSTTNTQPHKK